MTAPKIAPPTQGALAMVLMILAVSCASGPNAKAMKLKVDAGSFTRIETVVRVTVPNVTDGPVIVKGGGRYEGGQVTGGELIFVVHDLPAGQSRTYEFGEGTMKGPGEPVTVMGKNGGLNFEKAGKLVLRFNVDKVPVPNAGYTPEYSRGGYIHPVMTPGGHMVTDDYAPNHKHHHGIWWAWTKTSFEDRHPDFWNLGDKKGTVQLKELTKSWAGAVESGAEAKLEQIDLLANPAKTALNERLEVRSYAIGAGSKPCYIFDLTITDECATASPLMLPEYRYGGLGFRGNRGWEGSTGMQVLTSEGVNHRDAKNAERSGIRARWIHMGEMVDGQFCGLAILDHPSNFRAPQSLRTHPDEPFVSYAPQQLGDMEIKPGEKYVSKYRFVVADGAPDKALIDRIWNDFAEPPTVTLVGQ